MTKGSNKGGQAQEKRWANKMAMISLKEGGTFFGVIMDYNWKEKFLVVDISSEDLKDKRIIHWDNVCSVYDEEYNKEVSE